MLHPFVCVAEKEKQARMVGLGRGRGWRYKTGRHAVETLRTSMAIGHWEVLMKKETCAGGTLLLGLLVLISVIRTLFPKLCVPKLCSLF